MNVICLLSDTLRRDVLGAYGCGGSRDAGNKRGGNGSTGYRIETPAFDRFAEKSVVFDQSYMGSYPCMPARQDLFTGKYNFVRRGWSPLEYHEHALPGRLREYGRNTMLVTDHYHLWQAGAGNYHFSFHGTEFVRGQEMDNWVTDPDLALDWPAIPDKLNGNWEKYARNTARFRREEDYFTPQVFGHAIDWLDRNRRLDNFFLMIDLFDPHEPFDPPDGYVDAEYEGNSVKWPVYGDANRYTEQELARIRELYTGEVVLVDKWFGKMMERLESLGRMEDTMIIVTSDHGFLFGEHHWIGKHSPTLYNPISHTPLIIYHPHCRPKRVDRVVQMPDLYPTILEAMEVPVPDEVQGSSLLPLMRGEETDWRSFGCFGVFGGSVYVTDGEWVYVRRPQRSGPLYWYTDSHYQMWDFGQQLDVDASRRRREVFNGRRFPVKVPREHLNDAVARTEKNTAKRYGAAAGGLTFDVLPDVLYHTLSDYGQAHNLAQKKTETVERMKEHIREFLRKVDAPPEQFVRLGL